MPTVETKLSRIKNLIKGKLSVQELEKVLFDMGMELENLTEDDLKVEITAERIDLITPEGLARAINCYQGFVKNYQDVKVKKGDYIHNVNPSVKKYRAFTRSFVVKGLKFSDEDIKSLMWTQEKLHDTYGRKRKKVAVGVYDLNKIRFPVNYCAKKPNDINFVPLGMKISLSGNQILSKHPAGRDYAHLIEKDDKYPVQEDNSGQILSMPPIINSDSLGRIDTKTKDIFVECTGSDEGVLDTTMDILSTMFYDWGGQIYSVTIKDGNKKSICPNLQNKKRSVSVKFINEWIGLDLKPLDVKKLLPKMEYDVLSVKGDQITFNIPSVRADIWHDVDIADDLARAYGYNNIKPTLPNVSTVGEMLLINILKEDLCNLLANLGLIEVKTFALTSSRDQYENMNIHEEKHISLGKNTNDKNVNMIRSWLTPELMKALVANRNKEYPQNIFEADIVVLPDETADVRSKNVNKLSCVLCGEKENFTKIKGILDILIGYLGLEYSLHETNHNSFISGRVGKIIINKKEVGIIGEIHPQVLVNLGLELPVSSLELNLEEIFK